MKICFRSLRTRVELGLILLLVAVVWIGGMTACSSGGATPPRIDTRGTHAGLEFAGVLCNQNLV